MSLLKKILFKNKSTGGTPVNATSLNLMQDNTETAINTLETEQISQGKNIKTNTDKNTAQDIEIEKLKSNLIKLQAEGEEIQVNDSSDLEAKIEIYGNTKQETTEGKNLIDVEDWFKTCDIPYTKEGNIYHITDVHNAYYNPYTLKFPTDLSVSIQGIIKGITATNVSIDIHPVGSDKFYGWIKEGQTTHENVKIDQIRIYYISNGTCDLSNFQIEEGAKVTQYEPYTGGQASPNPEYPQEIESVKAYNLFDGIWEYGTIDYSTGNNIGIPDTIRTVQYIPIPYKRIYINQELDKNCKLRFYGKDKNYIGGDEENLLGKRTEKMFSFMPPKNAQYLRLSIDNENNPKYKLMCNIGEPKPYSPYGEIAVKQTGKNLLNPNTDVKNGYWTQTPDNFQVGAIWYSFYKYLRKGTYTISVIPQQVDKDVVNKFERFWIDGIETPLFSTNVNQTTTITLKENGLFACNIVAKGKDYTKQPYIQLEEGTEPSPYEPYKEKIYPIKLGNTELNGIADLRDRPYKENGKWYFDIKWDKYIFTGEETSIIENSALKGLFQITLSNVLFDNTKVICFSNYLIGETGGKITSSSKDNLIATSSNNRLFMKINKYANNIAGFKKWLKDKKTEGNPMYAIYPLATPTKTEITDPVLIKQLDNLENAKLFKPTTILTNNSIAIMKLDYIADTKAYIDNKLSQIAIANEKPKAQIMQNTPQTIPERLETTNKTENTNKETI